ncbi:MAG: hypothetical protein GY835_02865 [bacterium]|nr:hypothetical protein [bacterium]
MRKYLYRFGFCTPGQWLLNEAHGWDDESSYAFFVVADTSESALSWGREISEAFIEYLFASANWQYEIPSWKTARFAHWIEEFPEAVFSLEDLNKLPVVGDGQIPDFSEWSMA